MPPRSSQNMPEGRPRKKPNEGQLAEETVAEVRVAKVCAAEVPVAEVPVAEVPVAEVPVANGPEAGISEPFWLTKTLEAMTPLEWESLCDMCGLCCLVKLEDEDSGKILLTDIGCKLFDSQACRCLSYPNRQKKVGDCVKLTPAAVRRIPWLPKTCAYRLVKEGRTLEPWHPLISGSTESVHEAGISARGRTNGSEKTVRQRDYVDHIVTWDD